MAVAHPLQPRRPMRFRELRQLLQSIVVAGLPVAASGCNLDSHEPCSYEEKSRILTASEPADAVLQLKIDSCRLDVEACPPLCGELMDRANVNQSVKACSVTFAGNEVTAIVQYTIYHDGPNCSTEGRRPAGLVLPAEVAARSAAGAWLAQAAWMEAASVHAFVHLAAELVTAHRARSCSSHSPPRRTKCGTRRWSSTSRSDTARCRRPSRSRCRMRARSKRSRSRTPLKAACARPGAP